MICTSKNSLVVYSIYTICLWWKQFAFPIITTMFLWQLLHLGTIGGRAHCFHDCIYILRPSCFCGDWVLCVSWITYDHTALISRSNTGTIDLVTWPLKCKQVESMVDIDAWFMQQGVRLIEGSTHVRLYCCR